MIERLISIIAPHHCVNCRHEGGMLCAACLDELIDCVEPCCVICRVPTSSTWLCDGCQKGGPIDQVWISGNYEMALKDLLYAYKFGRAKNAYISVAELLDAITPTLFTTTIVVSVPTIAHHVRVRGYDHAALVARRLAQVRGLPYVSLLDRKNNYRQVGSDRKTRLWQAKHMFVAHGNAPEGADVLLIDDVVTTGATIQAAAGTLKAAGAARVFVAACAYEKLRQ